MTEQIDTSVEAVEREITVACIGDTPLAALLRALRAELTAAQSENTNLRAALAVSKDPCIYCQLPAEEMVKCRSGFPGCGRADDISGCPEFGAMMNETNLREELTAANARADQARNAALEEMLRLAQKIGDDGVGYKQAWINLVDGIRALKTTAPAVDDSRERDLALIRFTISQFHLKGAYGKLDGPLDTDAPDVLYNFAAFKAQDPQP